MTIALVSALAIGEFFTALVITAFVLAAEILEGLTVGRGRRAIQDMLDFLPQTASVLRNEQIIEVDTKTIVPGEVVIIRPGGKIPVDGRVLSGHSFVEQAAITGEPMPSEKLSGSDVYAGTINQAGTLQVRAERLGKETTFGKIIEAVENAERSRAPIQKTADRLAGYLVYFALGAAVLTFLITHNLRSTISVIIVAGACGIAAGTDVARESADVVLIGNDLDKFVETVQIAKNCRRIILQNFYGTLIVDTIGIGLAAAGFLNPLLATFIHVASELTFILNSTRLLPPREKAKASSQEQSLARA
jgi:cation transport ATPase